MHCADGIYSQTGGTRCGTEGRQDHCQLSIEMWLMRPFLNPTPHGPTTTDDGIGGIWLYPDRFQWSGVKRCAYPLCALVLRSPCTSRPVRSRTKLPCRYCLCLNAKRIKPTMRPLLSAWSVRWTVRAISQWRPISFCSTAKPSKGCWPNAIRSSCRASSRCWTHSFPMSACARGQPAHSPPWRATA